MQKKQIPSNSRGIIIFDVTHTKEMVDIVQEKISQNEYSHIICVLLVGNGAWSVPTGFHKGFPLDFVAIPAKPYER